MNRNNHPEVFLEKGVLKICIWIWIVHMEHAYAYGLICLKIGYQAKQQLILSKLELKLFMVPY